MTRSYVCPECGYDGFRMSELTGTIKDVSVQPGCPACKTLRDRTVMLVETSDPRKIADAEA